jgi:hypothetical protein
LALAISTSAKVTENAPVCRPQRVDGEGYVNSMLAIQYIQKNGSPIEQARLNYLLHDQPASQEIIADFCASQNRDGSWSPFWSPDYSSLDATCFHFAQAQQLGIDINEPALTTAVAFIAERQKRDGSWEEEKSVAEIAPPWAKPGDQSALLYLTANCGYWLLRSQTYREKVRLAGSFLAQHLDETGQFASFLQTHWLAVAIWQKTGMEKQSQHTMRSLRFKLDQFSANNLTWMITALRSVDIPANQPLITEAIVRLASLQQMNGRWQSDDGSEYDVHTTLEALFAHKLCEKI